MTDPPAATPSARPRSFDNFIGQNIAKNNLRVFICAAKERAEALDHVLISGPPGLGKTTLAQITAYELDVAFRASSGPVLARPGDLAALLTNLNPNDVFFIDEIHRMPPAVEEILYSALEDFQLDLIIGEGPAARSVRIDLPAFTLVGATTRLGLLSTPLRDRFGIPVRLDFYHPVDLTQIILGTAQRQHISIHPNAAREIASRARGTPRIAVRLLRRVRDFAQSAGVPLDAECAANALTQLDVDPDGLDALDARYLHTLVCGHGGGPVGVDTLAASLSESRDSIEEVVEPFLLRSGHIARTARGRVATSLAYQKLGLEQPENMQNGLFDSD